MKDEGSGRRPLPLCPAGCLPPPEGVGVGEASSWRRHNRQALRVLSSQSNFKSINTTLSSKSSHRSITLDLKEYFFTSRLALGLISFKEFPLLHLMLRSNIPSVPLGSLKKKCQHFNYLNPILSLLYTSVESTQPFFVICVNSWNPANILSGVSWQEGEEGRAAAEALLAMMQQEWNPWRRSRKVLTERIGRFRKQTLFLFDFLSF